MNGVISSEIVNASSKGEAIADIKEQDNSVSIRSARAS